MAQVEPEIYYVAPTPTSPNSVFPLLVYRNVLKHTAPEDILDTIEPNGWKKGGQWTTYKIPHYHTTVHETYGIIRGSSTYSMGKTDFDPEFNEQGQENGLKLHVSVGDVFVVPAGVSHCSLDSEGDYEFIGLYSPEDKQFDMNMGKAPPERTKILAEKCENLPIPDSDPIYGKSGPLPRIWKKAKVDAKSITT
ncbi:hypothetical protein L228DRAFT_242531 [Xylona heveae TC161]|uniref:Cupin type-1 domain-containing protein n=1 Tax=Xylona heveae (strain CBS 132557 / TC161) TaxID=1328760 RepID=A0A165JE53_XYLHT|nr:hypothetical protein L228DRAFT_242531 [Xylona heveae TC161]KZF26120.1 hypothetical protein L228DRAFT_242531 [Xylona heveae TC161]